jgi:uncharacterized protein (DUF58 family)
MSSTEFTGRQSALKRAMGRDRRRTPQQTDTGMRIDWGAWRTFGLSVLALTAALLLALYSSVAAEDGRTWAAALSATTALAVSGWVAFTVIPVLARRTPLRWLAYRMDYRVTREGIVYLAGIFVIALAALNTGNNLLFITLACLLAGILISGVLSQTGLSGVELRLDLPEHIFAGQPVMALAELTNHKQMMPSFSLRLMGIKPEGERGKPQPPQRRKTDPPQHPTDILTVPVYFPYVPPRQHVQQAVQLVFPRRGIYRQEHLGLQTRFPFGFLEKTRQVESNMEAIVYPSVSPSEEFYEILPLVTGELESFKRGRGHDLYSIRDYQTSDSARHVDWKASARTGSLQVREFAREDERRLLLVLDSAIPSGGQPRGTREALFDRGVALCASLAWHFHELDSVLAFRSGGFETPMAPAGEIIYDVLRHLACAAPADSETSDLSSLADLPHTFKIIITAQPRGSIPTGLWSTSFIAFLE